MTTITDNAARLIAGILLTDYNDGCCPATDIEDWAWNACGGFESAQAAAGTLARAVDAGLVWHHSDGDDSTVGITKAGWAAFTRQFGACDENDYDAYTDLAQRAYAATS